MTWKEFESLLIRIGWDIQTAIQLWHIFDTDKSGTLSKEEFLRFANHKEVVSYIMHLEQTLPSTTWFLYGGKSTRFVQNSYVWPYKAYEQQEIKVVKKVVKTVESYDEPAWYHETCKREVDSNMCLVAAETLRKAMKGLGTNNKKIIKVMGDKSSAEMQEIRKAFNKKFKRDLLKDLKSETSGNFDDLLSAITMDKIEYDAYLIRKAVKGMGTDEETLINVLCTRSPEEISSLSTAYGKIYNKNMLQDIKGDTSKNFQKILVNLCEGKRSMGNDINGDTEKFYEATMASDVNVFIDMLTGFSRAYIHMLDNKYKQLHGKSLATALGAECSGDAKKCLQALCTPVHIYVSEKLKVAMKGAGTKDKRLIQLIASQKERHLKKISKHFLEENKKSLKKWIKDDTSGNYGALLVDTVTHWG